MGSADSTVPTDFITDLPVVFLHSELGQKKLHREFLSQEGHNDVILFFFKLLPACVMVYHYSMKLLGMHTLQSSLRYPCGKGLSYISSCLFLSSLIFYHLFVEALCCWTQ